MLTFAPIAAIPYATWLNLWLDYSAGQLDPADGLHAHTYARLCQANELHGLVALDGAAGGSALGLAHYYFHPSTWALTPPCYVQDLFVHPRARGRGLGRALMEAVAAHAREQGSHVLHWNTRAGNEAANALYASFAQRSDRVSYLLPLAATPAD